LTISRVCTICGVQVGEPHKRKTAWLWKRKPRNLILNIKEMEAKKKELLMAKN